jgi:hypothetical protein
MNWNRLGSYLVSFCLVSLVATAGDVQANALVKTDKKKQSFDLVPKAKKKSFIDFTKFKGDTKKFESVKFKPKKKSGKPKPAAKFKFGPPVMPAGSSGHTVSVEMVSLSLVSVNPVSLDPFFEDNDPLKGTGLTGALSLKLGKSAFNGKSPARLDPTGKKKGKVDIKLDKKFKVSTKKGGKKKTKDLDKKKLKALNVGFSYASPITITDPSFCLQDDNNKASICLAPMAAPNPIPLPGALALMAPALGALLMGQFIRRRRQNGT